MKFDILPTKQKIADGKVIYRPEEYSFDFETDTPSSGTSLLVNDLHLEVDEDQRILYVWGVCPYYRWQHTDRNPPSSEPGILVAILNGQMIPGVSHRLTKPSEWPILVNPESGWICIGDPDVREPFESVEFATNSIAVLKEGMLRAIWLLPEELPDVIKR